MPVGINDVQVMVFVISMLFVGIGLLLSRRQWRRSAAVEAYGRSLDAYSALVVANTTYRELSLLGLGSCVFSPMTLMDSRLEHYWRILVEPERVQEVRDLLRLYALRVIDCVPEDVVACCLHDQAFYALRCCFCGNLLENRASILCQSCRLLLPNDKGQ